MKANFEVSETMMFVLLALEACFCDFIHILQYPQIMAPPYISFIAIISRINFENLIKIFRGYNIIRRRPRRWGLKNPCLFIFIGQLPRRVDFSFWNVLYSLFFFPCGQIFSFYTVQILTFADDSSLTLKATNFFLYDQFLPRYKPTVLECCNILNKDSHRRSRRNLFSVVGLSSVCVFSP